MVSITVVWANVWTNRNNRFIKQKGKTMRQRFVKAKDFAQAFEKCPWANSVSKVRGEYMCSDTVIEYHTER